MLEPRLLRADIDRIAAALKKRYFELDIRLIKALEQDRKSAQVKVEQLQALRNSKSKQIGQLKAKGLAIQTLLADLDNIKQQLKESITSLNNTQQQLQEVSASIPNIPHDSVPEGKTEIDNEVIKIWGDITPFDFEPKDHVDLGESLGLIDFENAIKMSGSRFVVMHRDIACLHRALIQFMLNIHSNEHHYEEISVPYLVNQESCFVTGQLPKFEQDLFCIKKHDLYLIPTAEVPVTNIARNAIFNSDSLPQKYVCYSPCFRSEAGSYGKDTRGMIRQHQFEKVELVQLVKPETSYAVLEELTSHAEVILQRLELPYRVVNLCGGDLGFASAKTYDIEVWLPGQNKYREISSCSNFEAFQARRMQARWRNPTNNKPELLHTLNGSGVAVGRALVAILENYQDKDGNVAIPKVLQPYMNGQKTITQRKALLNTHS